MRHFSLKSRAGVKLHAHRNSDIISQLACQSILPRIVEPQIPFRPNIIKYCRNKQVQNICTNMVKTLSKKSPNTEIRPSSHTNATASKYILNKWTGAKKMRM